MEQKGEGVTLCLLKRVIFMCYWEDSTDIYLEADPTEMGIEGDNPQVPIQPVLLKDKDVRPDEISVPEGLAGLQGTNNPTSDALLFSISLMLWQLERFSPINHASVAVRKILSSGKSAERFNRAV